MQTRSFKTSSSKMEIIGFLATRHGFRRYLELCTPTTGTYYEKLDRQILPTAHRLMYNCPANFEDGLVTDFRSDGLDIGECLSEINSKGLRYDIILVDSWHEYDTSYRDLRDAFDLIDEGGMLVVHDCLPPNAASTGAKFIPGGWCGLSYKAYLDFVYARHDLDYFTVDTDIGCGIIRKLKQRVEPRQHGLLWLKHFVERRQRRLLWRQWHKIKNDVEWGFFFFIKHKDKLLNLISVDEFLESSANLR